MNERLVLVVEDDRSIQRILRDVFLKEGFQVRTALTGRDGMVEAGSRRPDFIVLDLGLPDLDGKEFLRDLRQWSDIPVLVLSARGAEEEKVLALDAGADDFLVKPFGVPELLARLRALLRRHDGRGSRGPFYRFGQVVVDIPGHTVHRAGELVRLTSVEFRLLVQLVRSEGKVVTQRQLLQEVWGPGHCDQTHYLRIYMAHLRKKLEDDPTRPAYLLTETGVGCRCLAEKADIPHLEER
ncbi:MAG TPA: response regulator [Fibrobacteria bacterium]|nr:response regulator [Fibrobacteria bacterium]